MMLVNVVLPIGEAIRQHGKLCNTLTVIQSMHYLKGYVFFSGISLAVIEPSARADFWFMVEKLKTAGVCIVFDPNYRARMWDNPAQAKEQFEKAFLLAHIALPGVDDFQQLYSISTSEGVYEFCKLINLMN